MTAKLSGNPGFAFRCRSIAARLRLPLPVVWCWLRAFCNVTAFAGYGCVDYTARAALRLRCFTNTVIGSPWLTWVHGYFTPLLRIYTFLLRTPPTCMPFTVTPLPDCAFAVALPRITCTLHVYCTVAAGFVAPGTRLVCYPALH